MLFGRSLRFDTTESAQLVLGRLSALVLDTEAIAALEPARMSDWMTRHAGKRFVGTVRSSGFKLGLLPAPGTRFRVRGSVVVIVGSVEGRTVRVRLRPPLFVSAFLLSFTATMGGGLALSFFGPLAGHPLQALLALALVLPLLVVGGFFRREARLAEQALREVFRGA